MQNKKDEDGSRRHRSTISEKQSLSVSHQQGDDSRRAESAATRNNNDRRCGTSADAVGMPKEATSPLSPGESSAMSIAARLRSSSRLPRPTASASNDVVEVRRQEASSGARRSRRLPTLQGVVFNSPTYSASRSTSRLLANIISSKCRIPAPATRTRRISSWTDGCVAQTAASRFGVGGTNSSASEYYSSRSGCLSSLLNFGDRSTTAEVGAAFPRGPNGSDAAGSDAAVSTTKQEVQYGVRFSSDAEKSHREHVCCGCDGSGMVESHLSCVRWSATSAERPKEVGSRKSRRGTPPPRSARVYRFDTLAVPKVAVAEQSVEAGLEMLPSDLRRSAATTDTDVPQATSGFVADHKYSSDNRAATATGQVNDELQLRVTGKQVVVAKNEQSQLSEVADLYGPSSLETVSKIAALLSSKRNDQKPETATAPLSFRQSLSHLPRLKTSNPEMSCSPEVLRSSNFTNNPVIKDLAVNSQTAHEHQLVWSSYNVTHERKTAMAKEKSVDPELLKNAKRHLFSTQSTACQSTAVGTTKTSKEESTAFTVGLREAAAASRNPIQSHMLNETPRSKRLQRKVADRQSAERKSHESPESSRTDGERLRSTRMSGRGVQMSDALPISGVRGHSLSIVSAARKNEERRSQRSAGGHQPSNRPPWRDILVAAPRQRRQESRVSTETATAHLPEHVNDSAASEFKSADRSINSALITEEQCEVNTYPAVGEARLMESSETAYTSENLAVTEPSRLICDNTVVSDADRGQHPSNAPEGVQATTPSFLIGIAPPLSLDDYHRRRPVRQSGDSDSVEPTPSFLSCSTSEKDLPRQKNAASKLPIRRKICATSYRGSTNTDNENVRSSTHDGGSKSRLSPVRSSCVGNDRSLLMHVSRNKSSSQFTSTEASADKSNRQRKSESRRTSAVISNRTGTSTSADWVKRSSIAHTEGNLHKEKGLSESNKRARDSLSKHPNSDQSECSSLKKRATDTVGTNTSRMMSGSLQFNDASRSGRSQFSVETASIRDSKQANNDEMPLVPLLHSPCLQGNMSNDSPRRRIRRPVSFFISFPRESRRDSRTAAKASRIPGPKVGAASFPVRSHSYVIIAAGNLTETDVDCPSTEQHPASPERSSAKESPSRTSVELPFPVSHGSGDDSGVHLTAGNTVDPVGGPSDDVVALNNLCHRRPSDDKSPPAENIIQPPPVGVSTSALSANEASNFTIQGPAVVTESNNEEVNSRCLTYQETTHAVESVPKEPSERSQSLQFASSGDSSDLSVEANLEELPTEACVSEIHYSSISPTEHTHCTIAERFQFIVESDHLCPVKVQVAELDNNALQICTAASLSSQRPKTSKKASRKKSARAVSGMSLDIGPQVRLRTFDDVTIELAGIVWSKLQSGEIHHPEIHTVRLCRTVFEAVVLRSSPIQSSTSSACRQVDRLTPIQRAAFPSLLYLSAAARRGRHSDDDTAAEVSINIVRSRVDRAVQAVRTVLQLSPPPLCGWLAKEDAVMPRTVMGTRTREDHLSAGKHLDQLESDLTSTNEVKEKDSSPRTILRGTKRRQKENRHQLDDTTNTDEPNETSNMLHECEAQENNFDSDQQSTRPKISLRFIAAPKIENKKTQTDEQPCLLLPLSVVDASVKEEAEAKVENIGNVGLRIRENENGDDAITEEPLPVLAAMDKHGPAGEPFWQPSKDNEFGVGHPPQLTSGQYTTPEAQ